MESVFHVQKKQQQQASFSSRVGFMHWVQVLSLSEPLLSFEHHPSYLMPTVKFPVNGERPTSSESAFKRVKCFHEPFLFFTAVL